MKKVNELDLSHLYQENLGRSWPDLDHDPEFWAWNDKYRVQKNEYNDFIESCSLEDFVKLILLSFKEKYPRMEKIEVPIFKLHYKQMKPLVYKEFERTGLKYAELLYNTREVISEGIVMTELSFLEKFILDLEEDIIESGIEDILHDLSYSKKTEGDKIIYDIEESPIKQVEIKKNRFTLVINQEKWVDYSEYFVDPTQEGDVFEVKIE